MDKQFYNMKELAEIIPIGTNNLYNLVHAEGFPAITINRRIVIPVEEFNEWIKNPQERVSNSNHPALII